MRRLQGRAAAPGIAIAPAALVRPPQAASAVPAGTPDEERTRLEDALRTAASELRALATRVRDDLGDDEAAIFEAHAAFAADPELASRARSAIDGGATADEAVTAAFGEFRTLLAASSSEYLAARATDLDDVRDRVRILLAGGTSDIPAPTEPSVIVAHELTPSQTASIPRASIAALVTESGSPTSHAAILARSLEVPAVVAVSGLLDGLHDGTILAVDGGDGQIVVEPDDDTRARLTDRADEHARRQEELAKLRGHPGRTADGHPVEIAANIASEADLRAAVAAGAQGSGLVRTEMLYLERTEAPSIDEQATFVAEVLQAFAGERVVVRTLDVGADKPLPFVAREPEPNPALGLRGIRLSLAQPTLFRDQLRALLRAREAAGDRARLAIMFPLVCQPAEFAAARRHLTEVAEEAGVDLNGVEVGVMVETPAAALAADALAAQADFLSIGTNDLLQYLFAVDRLNAEVADLADPADPLALRLIGEVVEAAHRAGAWVGVCGEAASDPALAVALVGLGVDELSMASSAVGEVKAALHARTRDACRSAADVALGAPDAAGARRAMAELLGDAPTGTSTS